MKGMKLRLLAMGGILTTIGLVLTVVRGFSIAYLGISILGIVFLLLGLILF